MTTSPKTPETAIEQRHYQRRIAFLLAAVSNQIATGASRLLRQGFDLGLGEGRLLYVLGYENDLTAGRASLIMAVDKAATSRALAVLERRELVKLTVDQADARQKVIHLTPSGKRVRDRMLAAALAREKRLLATFSAEEVEVLADLLERLRAHIPTVRTPKLALFVTQVARARKARDSAPMSGRRSAAKAKAPRPRARRYSAADRRV